MSGHEVMEHAHTPCHIPPAANTRYCSAAGHVTFTLNIGVRVYCCGCACAAAGGGVGRASSANAPPQHRGCDHVMRAACFKPAIFAFGDINCICSFQEQVARMVCSG